MKRFITVSMWEETKDKLEQVRAQVIDDLVAEYLNNNSKGT